MVRQAVSEAKLRKILELNDKLKEQLEIQRIPISEASRSLIDHCQTNPDMMVPSVWGGRNPDPFAEPAGECACVVM
ncbi:G-protein gamma-like domain-containing protein [Syncephalastrum racemosum]|uniref:Guanine nucleotide-binding protein subunit gamma n=1 Tax=Syncephalastrum racemosum TaxID=13706 RepID=A0A1X2H8S2_SYNRA|nr:G-protein gamma-like domain-containing protein [Syncephalastrum racemosum]